MITRVLKEICKVDWGNTSLTKKSYVNNGQFLGVSAAGADGRMDHFEHEVGVTVISAIGANCGRVFFPEDKFTAIKNTITLTPNIEIIYPKYLFFSLQNNKIPKRGAGQPFVSKGDVEKYQISFPPVIEQKHIVEILEKADNLRKKRQEADEKGNAIIQAVFLDMFGDPIGSQKKWPIKSIGESVEFVDYGLAEKLSAAITSKEGIPIVRISNVLLDGSMDLSDMRYIQVSKDIESKLTLRDCDLLFNWRNGSPEHVGKTAMWRAVEQKHIFVSFLLRIRFKEGVTDPWYLWQLINYLRKKDYFKNISRMQINTKFNATELRAMKIPVPRYDLQQKFADLVQKVEKIKEKQQESKQELDNLFNSLLQKNVS